MKYYVNAIEQIFTTNEESVTTYSEYSKSEKCDDYTTALTKYYTKLANVSADIGVAHAYMHINITTSTGVMMKQEAVGSYVES